MITAQQKAVYALLQKLHREHYRWLETSIEEHPESKNEFIEQWNKNRKVYEKQFCEDFGPLESAEF